VNILLHDTPVAVQPTHDHSTNTHVLQVSQNIKPLKQYVINLTAFSRNSIISEVYFKFSLEKSTYHD